MILKGSQRGGARQMALHLLNGEQNEHVTVHQIRGFIAQNVLDALDEIYAQAKGTQCSKFLYSISLNPPKDESVPVEVFDKALNQIEEKLGLNNQPRVVVFHEKEGRRHAHCVWSRIDLEEMKAINIAFDHKKLQAVSRQLFLDHGWTMPKGLMNSHLKNPLNFTRKEWQQAARTGRSAKAIKACLQQCWAVADSRKAFENALQESGFYMAKGDRRGFVVVDVYDEVYSLPRQLGLKAKDVQKRLGDPNKLLSVDEIREKITGELHDLFGKYRKELAKSQDQAMRPILRIKKTMTDQHRKERAALKAYQDKRWAEEEKLRASRIRKGFKGLWDKLSGKYWKLRKQNEKEAWQCHVRDRDERQDLIEVQLDQRHTLQEKLVALHKKQEEETAQLIAGLSRMGEKSTNADVTPEAFGGKAKVPNLGHDKPARGRSTRKYTVSGKKRGKTPDAEPDT